MLLVILPRFGDRAEVRNSFAIECLVLRQQLAVFSQEKRIPHLNGGFRTFWVVLRRLWPRWKEVCVLVKPATVIAWHCAGFRRYWKWKSKGKPGRPAVTAEVRTLIRRMARENLSWEAPRIRGKLLKLGYHLSQCTVQRHMPKREPTEKQRQNWRVFPENHRDVMDFITVPTVAFHQLYALVILRHGRRRVAHVNVTEHPTVEWGKQQLREAFPFDEAPKYLIFDRDCSFSDVKGYVEARRHLSRLSIIKSELDIA